MSGEAAEGKLQQKLLCLWILAFLVAFKSMLQKYTL